MSEQLLHHTEPAEIPKTPALPNIRRAERRAMLLGAIGAFSAAATCAHPIFAIPALAGFVGAAYNFRKAGTFNTPLQ